MRVRMKRFFFIILYTLFLVSLASCQTVSKKIEDTSTKEEKELGKWLNKSEEELKNFYGQPDKVEFLKTRNRNYVYITEKFKIKCERKFEVNTRNIVVGFSSKNCF
jgi:phage-related protein